MAQTGRQRKAWDDLSPAVQRRKIRAGISKRSYESTSTRTQARVARLTAQARGHKATPERPERAFRRPKQYAPYITKHVEKPTNRFTAAADKAIRDAEFRGLFTGRKAPAKLVRQDRIAKREAEAFLDRLRAKYPQPEPEPESYVGFAPPEETRFDPIPPSAFPYARPLKAYVKFPPSGVDSGGTFTVVSEDGAGGYSEERGFFDRDEFDDLYEFWLSEGIEVEVIGTE